MILIATSRDTLNSKLQAVATEVWLRLQGGRYECIKQRRTTHTHHNLGVIVTERHLLTHLRAHQTVPNENVPNLGWPRTPKVDREATKTERPVGGGPNTLTRGDLREMIRDAHRQGITEHVSVDWATDMTNDTADKIIDNFINNGKEI